MPVFDATAFPSVEAATAWVFSDDGPLVARGYEIRQSQRSLALSVARAIDSEQEPAWVLGEAPCGCHARGQGVLMYDGTVKAVEDVVVGDVLMGPFSRPRRVLSLARGRQQMVDVVPRKGQTFRVNRDHVLTLVRQGRADGSRRADYRGGEVVDVRVSEVLDRWSGSRRGLYRLLRAPVREFGGDRDPLTIDPWVLGALLGDGGFSRRDVTTSFTSVDPPVFLRVRSYVESIGCGFRTVDDRHHQIIGPVGHRKHPLRNLLRELGLFGRTSADKFIPHRYKTASWADRLELLAGIIDTDGASNGCGGFDYVSKSRTLAEDAAFVARSVGLAAYVKPVEKRAQTGGGGTYWRVSISGDCSVVPVVLERKQQPARTIDKDPLRVGYQLTEREEEEFFGFELDGDGRFLLDDFTVTHNTGKGMAYLVPGIIASLREEAAWATGRRREGERAFRKLVVSTANIALQGQLVNKDIPGVAEILGVQVRSALYKGRNNFICREKLQEQAAGLITDQGVRRLYDWTKSAGCSGDREDLTWDPGGAWARVSAGSDECHGKKCPYYRPENRDHLCYAERARVGMDRAHVVIVNHYLLALSPQPIPSVCLAVDEGHELEDCIRTATSSSLGERGFAWLGSRVQNLLGPEKARDFAEPLEGLFLCIGAYVDATGARYKASLPEGWHGGTFDVDRLAPILRIAQDVAKLARQEEDENESGKLEKLADALAGVYQKAYTLAEGAPHAEMSAGSDSPWAVWVEIREERSKGYAERRLTGNMAPADISARFMALQRAYPRGLVTSATLAVDGAFAYVRSCLGMGPLGAPPEFGEVEVPDPTGEGEPHKVRRQIRAAGPVEELILPSPYDLEHMGALVVPADVMSPKSAGWQDWATFRVIEAVQLAEGRTLVLASSYRMMERYGFALEERTSYPVRVQGSAGRNELIRWFTETEEGVLVATRSFFQGLDVKGESLSCVVIDRVPFDPPGDPLEEVVAALVAQRAGGSPFNARSLPKACMTLAQAAGRLIRSQGDRGVVVCLDSKVVTGSMATPLRRSFSGLPLSRDIRDIPRVIAGEGVSTPRLRAGSIRRGHYHAG